MNAINRQETDAQNENALLERRLLELSYGKVGLAVMAAFLLSLLIVLGLWNSVPHSSLMEWAVLLWGVQGWHLYQQRRYLRVVHEPVLDVKRWERISVLAAVASGAVWGSTILWFPESFDDPAALLTIFVIAGCTAFGSVSMSAIPRAATLFLGVALAPLAAWLIAFGEHISIVMGAITVLYWASMVLLSRQIYAMTCRMFTSSEQNRVLVASFAYVKEQEQQAAQRSNERRYGGLFENFEDSIFFVDVMADGGFRIASVNPAGERMFGVKSAEVRGKSKFDLFPEDVAARLEVHDRTCVETRQPVHYEDVLLDSEGERHFSVTHIPMLDETGRVIQIAAIARDVTAQKCSDMLLKTREAQFRTLAENAPDPIYRYDRNCRRIYINPAVERLTGVPVERLLGKSPVELLPNPSVDAANAQRVIQQVLDSGSPGELEVSLTGVNGRDVTIHNMFVPEFAEDGSVDSVLCIGRDVTARKHMEDILVKSEREYRTLADNSPDAIVRHDLIGRISYLNKRFENAAGIQMPFLLGKLISETFSDGLFDAYEQCVQRVIASGQAADHEISLPGTEQGKRDYTLRIVPEYDENGAVCGALGIGRDITERKRMENEMLQQAHFQQTLLNAMDEVGIGLAVVENGRVSYISNSKLMREFGLSESDLDAGVSLLDIIHPDDRARVMDLYQRRLAGETVSSSYELGLVTRDGKRLEFETAVAVVPGSNPVRVINVIRDISERKRTENVLRDSEKMLQDAQRIAHVGSWDVDMVNDKLTWSDEIFRIWEIDKTKFKADFAAFLATVHPEDQERVVQAYNAAIVNHSFYEVEHRLLFPDGRVKYILEQGEPQYDAQGKPVRFIGTSLDITERKRHEEVQMRLNRLAESAPGFMFTSHLRTDGTIAMPYASQAIQQVFGLQPGDVEDSLAPLQARIHEEDRARVAEIIQTSACQLSLCNAEFRVLHPEKGELWVEARSMPQAQPDGGIQWHGFMVDISERKIAAQYERFRTVIMEHLAQNSPLAQILEEIVRGVEQIDPAMICSVLLLDSQGQHLVNGVAPSLPDFYNEAIDGLAIGAGVGSCGTAAASGARVIVEDIATHPYWAPFQELATQAGLQACWSQPILAASGKVLGTFAIYHREPTSPTQRDIALIENAAQMASIAIERKHMEEELKLKEYVLEHARMGVYLIDDQARFVYVNEEACRELGYSRSELLTMTAMDIDAERLTDEVMEVRRKSLMDGSFTFEAKHVRRDGSHVPVEILASTITYQGKGLGVALALNISERKQLSMQLQESRERYLQIFDNAQEGMFLLEVSEDLRFRVLEANAAFARLIGISCADMHDKFVEEILSQETAQKVSEKYRRCVASGDVLREEQELLLPVGRHIYDTTLVPVRNEAGRIYRLVGISSDITERRRMEDEIRMKGYALDNSNDAMYLIGERGRFVYVNEQACRVLGYSREELLAMGVPDIDPDFTAPMLADRSEKVQKQGGSFTFETHHQRRDGTLMPVEIQMSELNYNGQVFGLALARDISERKRALNALQQSEMKFRTLYDSTGDAVMLLNEQGFFDCNAAALKMFGCATREEFCTKHPADLSPSVQLDGTDSLTLANRHIAQALQEGSHRFEWLHRRVDNNESFPAEVLLSSMELDGKPVLQATVRDISERKQAELALRASEAHALERSTLLNAIMESSPDVIVFALDREYRYLAFNHMHRQVMQAIWGKQIAFGMSMLEVMSRADDRATAQRDFDRALAGESFVTESAYGDEALSREYWQTFWSPIRSASGDVSGLTCYVLNISQRRRLEESLVARERDFRSLAENSPDNIARWDAEGRVLFCNPRYQQARGTPLEEMLGRKLSELIPEGDFADFEATVARVAATGEATMVTRLMPSADGELIHEVSLVPEFGNDGRVVSVLGIGRNMTEHYRMQKALSAREQEFRSLAGNIPDNIARWDTAGCYLYVNPTHERLLGMKQEDLIGKSVPDSHEHVKAGVMQVVATGQTIHAVRQPVMVDGIEELHDVSLVPEFDEHGNVVSVLGMGRNMTERYRMLEALAEREQEFRSLAESSPDFIIRYDRDGRTRYLNTALVRELGVGSADEMIGKRPSENWPDGRFNSLEQAAARAVETGEMQVIELIVPGKNGEMSYGMVSVVPERDTSGNIIGTIATGRDVTALRAMERLMQMIGDHMPGALTHYRLRQDLSGELLYASRGLQDIYGFTREDLADGLAPMIARIHPDDLPQAIAEQEQAAKEIITATSEFRVNHPVKGEIWVQQITTPVPEAGGSMLWYSLMFDISERKRMESVVAHERATLRAFFGAMPNLAWMKDTEGRYLACNPAHEGFLGAAETEIVGKTDFDFVDAELAAFFRQKDKEAEAAGKPCVNEEWVTFASDGRRALLETVKSPVFDAAGKVIGVIGVAHDITERKRMQEALAERQAFLDSLFEAIPVPVFYKDREGRYLGFNRAFETVFGTSREQLIGKSVFDTYPRELAETYHAKDAEVFERRVDLQQYEYKIMHANGTLRDVLFSKSAFTDARGEVKGLIGAVMDITDLKQAERQLKEALEFSEGVINAIPDLLFEVDGEGRYLNIWAQNQDLLAAQRDLLLGRTINEMLAPDAAAISMAAIREAEENGLSLGKTMCLSLPQGESWFELSVSRKPGAESGDMHFLVLSRDITERKQMEEALRASEEKLRNLFALSPLGLALTDMQGKYIEFNEAFRRICGYPEAELHTLDYWTLTPRKYEQQEMEQLASLASSGRYGPYEKEYRQKDGTLIPIQLNGVKVIGADGKEYIWSIVEDITLRKRMEASLRESRDFLRHIMDGITDPIFVKDRQHDWIEFNDAFCSLVGQPREAMLGKSDYDFLPKEQADVFWEKDELVFSTGETNINEESITSADGTVRYIQTKKMLVRFEGDEDSLLIGVIRDITERKQMEEALQRSEQLMRTVIDATPDWIFIKDREHRYRLANKGYANALHIDPDDFIGKNDLDLGFPEDLVKGNPEKGIRGFWADDRKVLERNETQVFTDDPAAIDGELHTFHTIKVPLRDANGSAWGVLAFARDITDRKKAEVTLLDNYHRITELNDELERSSTALQEKAAELEMQTVELEMSKEQIQQTEEWYRSIMHSAPDGMLIVDHRGIIMQTNAQLDSLFGYEGGELPGNRVELLVPVGLRDQHVELRSAFNANVGVDMRMAGAARNLMGRRKDGSEFPVDVSLSRLPDMEGREGAVCAAVRDMSERTRMEAAREQALSEALHLAQMRSSFLAQMSHELRTPLNGILGYAQNLLLNGGLGEKEVSGLNIIKHSGEHLLSLINGLLDHAAIEADKFELIPGDIGLEEFLATLIGIIRVRAEQKNIAFTCELDSGLPGMVRGDAQRLRQVLLNLLSNAVKFTDAGSVVLQVRRVGEARMRFEVRDSGVGIAPDQLEKIFLPFEQVGEVSRRAGGSGLGLAISSKLVGLMGGDIQVKSMPGQGSTFWFEIDMETVQSDVAVVNVTALIEQATNQVAQPTDELDVPPKSDLEALSGFVQRGSMRDVQRYAEQLLEQDERYGPFVEQLRKLAKNFQTKALRNLIDHYLLEQGAGE